MKIYRGLYKADFTIHVYSTSQKVCFEGYNHFKNLVKAVNFGGIDIEEEDRTSDEVNPKDFSKFKMYHRQISIHLIENVETIVIFRQMLDNILVNCNNHSGDPLIARMEHQSVVPYDRLAEFFNDTL